MELAGPSVAGCECQTPLANSPSSCERAFFMDYGKAQPETKNSASDGAIHGEQNKETH